MLDWRSKENIETQVYVKAQNQQLVVEEIGGLQTIISLLQ
jgi:hypothetical protein